jgi:uncharacterized protein
MSDKPEYRLAAEIVRDAGGQIVGRTRLQKVACLLELAGVGAGFPFAYHYYGPYSEKLSDAVRVAEAFDLVTEEERQANWGGKYSVFTATKDAGPPDGDARNRLAQAAAKIDAIELELAVTAAYLAVNEKCPDPWGETARRKPEKAGDGRLEKAKAAYRELLTIPTPTPLPAIG